MNNICLYTIRFMGIYLNLQAPPTVVLQLSPCLTIMTILHTSKWMRRVKWNMCPTPGHCYHQSSPVQGTYFFFFLHVLCVVSVIYNSILLYHFLLPRPSCLRVGRLYTNSIIRVQYVLGRSPRRYIYIYPIPVDATTVYNIQWI